MRVGFVPLLDAAPLILALELGHFTDEGLTVSLERQIGWGNVRDKLTFGQLHASHALLGMPLFSLLGRDGFSEPLLAVMNLGCGTDAITFSHRLIDAGVKNAAALARWRADGPGRDVPVFAHVFNSSVHHYLMRSWLAAAGMNPDTDVRLCVLPPLRVASQLAKGYLDGFCCGEPWSTLASTRGDGVIVADTTDVVPGHPDKVLAVNQDWASDHPHQIRKLIRATLKAMQFCSAKPNLPRVAEVLSARRYLDLPAEVILRSLSIRRTLNGGATSSFDPSLSFPSITHHGWLASEMVRWGHLARGVEIGSVAAACVQSSLYRETVADLGLSCPVDDAPPMPLRSGTFRMSAVRSGSGAQEPMTTLV